MPEWVTHLFSFITGKVSIRRIMYTVLLFICGCVFTPKAVITYIENIEVPFVSGKTVFYVVLFIISYLVVDTVVLVFNKILKNKSQKMKIKKRDQHIKKIIHQLDENEQKILFMFVHRRTNSLNLDGSDQYVKSLQSKEIIIPLGINLSGPHLLSMTYHINPSYAGIITEIYNESIE